LSQDKSKEALAAFLASKSKLPKGYPVEDLICRAEILVAFDNKDYDKFIKLALEDKNKHPENYSSAAQLSSAYSCKYAVTGDNSYKEKSLSELEKARQLLKTEKEKKSFEEHKPRILYRIESREIITRQEFQKRFPNGWKSEKEN
jgi:hypothetical protein